MTKLLRPFENFGRRRMINSLQVYREMHEDIAAGRLAHTIWITGGFVGGCLVDYSGILKYGRDGEVREEITRISLILEREYRNYYELDT